MSSWVPSNSEILAKLDSMDELQHRVAHWSNNAFDPLPLEEKKDQVFQKFIEEVAELITDVRKGRGVGDEIADVLITALHLADLEGWSAHSLCMGKLLVNMKRYPIPKEVGQ